MGDVAAIVPCVTEQELAALVEEFKALSRSIAEDQQRMASASARRREILEQIVAVAPSKVQAAEMCDISRTLLYRILDEEQAT